MVLRIVALRTLALLSACSPMLCMAETPFSGTWVAQPDLTAYSLRPLSFMIERGTYKRSSCVPAYPVPTDGKDHDVTGDPLVGSMSVRLLDVNRVEVTQKISGKLTWKGLYVVAQDQKSMTLKYQDQRAVKPVSGTIQFVRDGDVVANAHLLSGAWRPLKLLDLSAGGHDLTLRDTDHGLAIVAGDGTTSDVKLDAQDYPLNGYLPGATVQVGRRGTQTLQVNRRQNGILVEMAVGVVSDDGQTMLLSEIDQQCQSKMTWTLRKQMVR
jgi:hypothetical protein